MDLDQRDTLVRNWRGRRLLICRASNDLQKIVDHFGSNNGDSLPEGFDDQVSEELKAELKNQIVALQRTLLVLNDGRISPSKLNSF